LRVEPACRNLRDDQDGDDDQKNASEVATPCKKAIKKFTEHGVLFQKKNKAGVLRRLCDHSI